MPIMGLVTPQQPLGTAYYLDHFRQVIDAVKRRHGFLLDTAEHAHIRRIEALSPPAQMLYARLVNRRGPCFRLDRLAYAEIPMRDAAVAELAARSLILMCDAAAAPDLRSRLYGCFTVAELRASLAAHRPPRCPRRDDLLAWLGNWDGCDDWLAGLLTRHPVLRLPADDPWPFIRFLFFGELRDNLADFVTRELGHVVPESIDPGKLRAQFQTRREAVDAYRMACLYAEFRTLRDVQPPLATLRWWQAQGIARADLAAGAASYDRLVDRLGPRLERAGETAAALRLYETSPQAAAQERRARLLLKADRRAEAVVLLQALAADPCHAEAAYAARQILGRLDKTARRSEARHYQRLGDEIVIEAAAETVEAGTLAHYQRQGWAGVHSENWLWNAIFGLLFWDIIYDADLGMFHSPLQRAPADLHDPGFYERRRAAIEERLDLLQRPGAGFALIARHHDAKRGLANPFVSWQPDGLALMRRVTERLPAAGLGAVLRRLAQDIRRHARGFPDLFLWTACDYRFVEVKSANDQLSAAQYEWLRFFETAGLAVGLSNVRYRTAAETQSQRTD